MKSEVSTTKTNPSTAARSLAELLAGALDVDVQAKTNFEVKQELASGKTELLQLQRDALLQSGQAFTAETETGIQTAIATHSPRRDNVVAFWTSDTLRLARQTGRHAESVLALRSLQQEHDILQLEADSLREESQSLYTEVQSLVNQVSNDFEEIALIRSLATNMELSVEAQTRLDIAKPTLAVLSEGVHAKSLAMVFTDCQQQPVETWWTDEPLLDDRQLTDLIEQLGPQAMGVPVVRNDCQHDPAIQVGDVNEFILLQCRSQDRLHGWVIACDCTEIELVAWAQAGFTTEEASLVETVVGQLAAQFHNLELLHQKEALFTDVIRALVNAVEARDPYTCGHSARVALFARHFAKIVGYSQARCEQVYLTGLLHDVGKIAIPDGVLQKPSRLNDEERQIIETHTEAGWRILHELEALSEVLPGVLHHHERFDGKGYPDGLTGHEIPIDGRILAVCDSFDAMTSDRPYRKGMPVSKAVEILKGGAGTYWDPELIERFCSAIDQFDRLRKDYEHRQVPQRNKPDTAEA